MAFFAAFETSQFVVFEDTLGDQVAQFAAFETGLR
jgi:hypothetical protein